jgi:uncharacterized protein DUF4268
MDEILLALQNLGGQASSKEIINAMEQLRSAKLSEKERGNLNTYLHIYSTKFKAPNGQPYFRKLRAGIWVINDGSQTAVLPNVHAVSSNNKHVLDPGTVSFEAVSNSLRTIKEYRDYYDPQRSDWADYVYEIFHLLGFDTERIDSRLFFLKEMGNVIPEAIVLYSFPGEDSTSIAPGISWDSHLRFAASYLQVKWGILTNGMKLQVFNYGNSKDSLLLSCADLDTIIRDQNVERFFSIYKTFSYFRSPNVELPKIDANRDQLRLEFWKDLLAKVKPVLPRFSKLIPSKHQWIGVRSGKSGFGYSFVIRMRNAQVELYIDHGEVQKNKRSFDSLYSRKEEIEQVFGEALSWERLNDKRASRVSYLIENSGLLAKERWPEIQKQMIEAMVQLQKTLNPEINKLK